MLRRSHDSMPPRPPAPPGTPERLYLDNVDLISELAEREARKQRASAEEAEDFAQELHCKLIADDYAVLRKFKWTSSLKTYLTAVAVNAFRDFRIRSWGRWRPSATAKDLGPLAILLEELVDKEGWSIEEACEILRTNYRVPETRQQILEIWRQLPSKTRRHMEGDGDLTNVAALEVRPEAKVFEDELAETRIRVRATLNKVMQALAPEDRLIVKLRILKGVKIVTLADILGTEQKPLYRRLEKILEGLRSALEREEVRWEQVADLLNLSDFGRDSPDSSQRSRRRTEDRRPSI